MKPSDSLYLNREAIRRIVESHRARNPRVFGSVLHVSGADGSALERTLREATAGQYWRMERTDTGLEDVFIHLMNNAVDSTGFQK